MNNEEDEFRRIEREAKRRAKDDDDDTQGYVSEFALPQLREFLNELNDRIVRRYQGSDKDQAIAYGMEIVYVDLIDLIEGKERGNHDTKVL
jgi:predicted HTH domain antitoxin